MITTNQGKVRASVLIISLLILAFFVLIGWGLIYHLPNVAIQPSTSSSTMPGNSSITVAVSTSTAASSSNPVTAKPTSTSAGVGILSPESAASIGHVVGIAGGGVLSKISTSTLNQELDQMVTLGATWVRFDIEWGDVQYGSSSTFTWGSYDTLINAIVAHHLHALAIVLFTPQWARTSTCSNGVECPPANPATFATFAAEIAARYEGKVQAYEIWNEPNNYNFWAPHTSCSAYTTLLKATYPAIKKADPNAIVVTGGLAPETTDSNNTSPTDFLSCVYQNGGQDYFDAVGDHPYTFPAIPSAAGTTNAWAQMSETMPSLRSIMIANGDANKKIWITEFGTPTNGPDPNWYVSEAQQAQTVTAAMSLYKSYSWAGPIFWYTLQDAGNATDTNENFFGLTRADGSTKPAYNTLKTLISQGL